MRLYKLLLYRKGCLFKPHRDTQKIDDDVPSIEITKAHAARATSEQAAYSKRKAECT